MFRATGESLDEGKGNLAAECERENEENKHNNYSTSG